MILTFFIIRSIEKNIAPSAIRQGEYYSRLTANKIINKAVSDYLTENQYQYNDFSAVLYDENGKAVYASPKVLREVRLKIGLVFQNFNLFPHLTVLQNITLAPVRVLGRNRAAARETGMELLKRMGLESKAKMYPCELSGGQQQRVSIARALAMKPKILFFDEPTSALDPELTGEVLKIIKGLAEERMTMVIVTHEMAFARDVANRVLFMDEGIIVEQGTPQFVFEESRNERLRAFLARFSQNGD